MNKTTRKHHRIFAVILAAAVLLSAVPLAIYGVGGKDAGTMKGLGGEDRRIASEISNVTGAQIDEIIRLKNAGRSWNEVLTALKSRYYLDAKGQMQERDDLLAGAEISGAMLEKLRREGFSDGDVTEAKMLLERLVFELQEIASDSPAAVKAPAALTPPAAEVGMPQEEEDDTASYGELLQKIDCDTAVYLMLKLRPDFGSLENALDEYLYALQTDLDLNEYLSDRDSYLEKKKEKDREAGGRAFITLARIEEKSIERLERDNKNSLAREEPQDVKPDGIRPQGGESPLPDVPKPGAADVKPPNPADGVMKEIRAVNPMAD